MVAVTSRCLKCRAKKIKCDQDWPTCGPCAKSKQTCPGPPNKVKFVDSGKTSKIEKDLVAEEKESQQPKSKSPRRSKAIASLVQIDRLPYVELSVSKCNLQSSVKSSQASLVAIELIESLQLDTAPDHPSFFGSCCFIKDVPAMLESSAALTATVACCLDACAKDQMLPRKCRNLDPKLYGKALAAIKDALQQPSQRTCVSTFLAVALIGRLESLLVPRQLARIPCWSVHAGGISELLRYRGVFDPNDRTAYLAVLENFGPIIAHSVFQEQDCFLTAPEWQLVLQRRQDEWPFDEILGKVFAQLAFMPNLIRSFRRFRRGEPGAFAEIEDLTVTMYHKLLAIGKILEKNIIATLDEGPPTWMDINAPMRLVYRHPGHYKSRVISWHAVLTLIVNKMLISLSQMSAVPCSYSINDLVQQNHRIAQRVWMLSEEARRKGLVEFYFYPGALSSTYDCATDDNEREWIVELLNEVMGSTWSKSKWTHEAVEKVCLTLAGMLD